MTSNQNLRWSYVCVVALLILLFALLVATGGCNRGSIKMSPVIEGQAAPHAGWNFGPDSYLQPGDDVKVTGGLFWVEGLDPNDIVGE